MKNKDICERLVKQYNTQFSSNKDLGDVMDDIFDDAKDDISDITISEEDIQNAIRDIDTNSTAGPDGIPAIFFEKN